MDINITLPATHTVGKGPRDKSWHTSVTVDVSKLSAEMIALLAMHGLQQKIADSASQSKNVDEATAAMQKAMDAILDGKWTSRVAGDGADEFTRCARSVVHQAVKTKFGAKSPEWVKFIGLEPADQVAKLDEWFAANADAFTPSVNEEMARRAAKRDAKAGLAGAITIEL